ncbi:hypothetical protein LEN26_012687 [Aphanomyces euteiches]|nr:hypothetical protein LEN26_012687 [Aphanomyces euteiches]
MSHALRRLWVLSVVFLMKCVLSEDKDVWSFKHVHQLSTVADLKASGLETSRKFWFALYAPPDDPLLPVLDQVGQNAAYAVSIAWISDEIAKTYGVQAAKKPILFCFRDEPKWNPYQERMYRTIEVASQYPAPLDARGVKKLVRDKVPSKVHTSWDSTWNDPPTPRVVLVTKKTTPSLLYNALSVEFSSLGFYALADSSETQTLFPVKEVPSLLIAKSATESIQFTEADGDMTKFDDLHRFLEPHAPAVAQQSGPSLWLTREEFDKVPKDNNAWLVVVQPQDNPTVVDPSSDEWKQVVSDILSKVGLLVRFAMVDDSVGTGIFIVRYGKSTALEKITGGPRAAAAKLFASIPDKTAALYSSQDIHAFFGRMLQSSTPTISFVLFTAKQEAPLVVQALALSFPDRAHVGVVYNPDDEIKKQFGITKLPAMVGLMLPRDPNVPREQFSMTFYDKQVLGTPNFENLHRFVGHLVQAYASPPPEAPPAAVHAISTTEDFVSACSSLCVIGLRQGSSDDATVEVVEEVAKKSSKAKNPLQFMHVDAACQPSFASALGAEPWQVPTVAVYSPGKRRYVRHVGTMDADSVWAFVQSVLGGQTKTIPMSAAPELTKECAPVDVAVNDSGAVVDEEDDGDIAEMLREIREEEERQKEALKRQLQQEAQERKEAEEQLKREQESAKKPKTKKKKKRPVKDEL